MSRNNNHTKRVQISLPATLLEAIDKEAQCFFMTRSELLRRAFIWYMEPSFRLERRSTLMPAELVTDADEVVPDLYANPDELFKAMETQRQKATAKALLREIRQRNRRRRQQQLSANSAD